MSDPGKTARCFQVNAQDNVATALDDLAAGAVTVLGGFGVDALEVLEAVSLGHKVALRAIAKDEAVTKYGVPIGFATKEIGAGAWVHLHNCRSAVDERSSHLDVKTGAALDTVYA